MRNHKISGPWDGHVIRPICESICRYEPATNITGRHVYRPCSYLVPCSHPRDLIPPGPEWDPPSSPWVMHVIGRRQGLLGTLIPCEFIHRDGGFHHNGHSKKGNSTNYSTARYGGNNQLAQQDNCICSQVVVWVLAHGRPVPVASAQPSLERGLASPQPSAAYLFFWRPRTLETNIRS